MIHSFVYEWLQKKQILVSKRNNSKERILDTALIPSNIHLLFTGIASMEMEFSDACRLNQDLYIHYKRQYVYIEIVGIADAESAVLASPISFHDISITLNDIMGILLPWIWMLLSNSNYTNSLKSICIVTRVNATDWISLYWRILESCFFSLNTLSNIS